MFFSSGFRTKYTTFALFIIIFIVLQCTNARYILSERLIQLHLVQVIIKAAFLPVTFEQLADMRKQTILLMEKLLLWLFITYSFWYRESNIQDVVTQSAWPGAFCSGMNSSFHPVCPVSCSEGVIKMDWKLLKTGVAYILHLGIESCWILVISLMKSLFINASTASKERRQTLPNHSQNSRPDTKSPYWVIGSIISNPHTGRELYK